MSLPERSVPKPFKRGSCRACRSPENLVAMRLCVQCEHYAQQDYKGQPFTLITGRLLEDIPDENEVLFVSEIPDDENISPFTNPSIDNVSEFDALISSGLSGKQKKVVELYVRQGLTFDKIAQQMRISRQAVRMLYVRGLTALRKKLSIDGLVKGEEEAVGHRLFPIDNNDNSCVAQIPAREEQADEITVLQGPIRPRCPRCSDRLFRIDRNFRYCMHCMWNSDSETELFEISKERT